jgi:hypothetical protein
MKLLYLAWTVCKRLAALVGRRDPLPLHPRVVSRVAACAELGARDAFGKEMTVSEAGGKRVRRIIFSELSKYMYEDQAEKLQNRITITRDPSQKKYGKIVWAFKLVCHLVPDEL